MISHLKDGHDDEDEVVFSEVSVGVESEDTDHDHFRIEEIFDDYFSDKMEEMKCGTDI